MTRIRSHSVSSSWFSDDETRIARPLLRCVEQQPVDLGLRADVHAARRLVEHQHARAVASHFARTTFCWLPPESVATGTRDERGADAHPLEGLAHDASSRRATGRRSRARRDVEAITRFSRTVISCTRPWSLRSAGTNADPAAHRLARAAERDLRAVDLDRAAARAVEPEHGLEQLAPPGADETGETHDLARLDVEVHAGTLRGSESRAGGARDARRAPAPPAARFLQRAPDHELDQPRPVELRGGRRAHRVARRGAP